MILLSSVTLGLTGCTSTVVPRTVQDSVASFDGNQQNSGLIGFTKDGFAKLTPHARDRYNTLTDWYGKRFTPILNEDAGVVNTGTNVYLMDKEHLVMFGKMNQWKKQENK